jgi:hypothetical protein
LAKAKNAFALRQVIRGNNLGINVGKQGPILKERGETTKRAVRLCAASRSFPLPNFGQEHIFVAKLLPLKR